MLLGEGGRSASLLAEERCPASLLRLLHRLGPEAARPLVEAIEGGEPRWIAGREALEAGWPALAAADPEARGLALLPIVAGGRPWARPACASPPRAWTSPRTGRTRTRSRASAPAPWSGPCATSASTRWPPRSSAACCRAARPTCRAPRSRRATSRWSTGSRSAATGTSRSSCPAGGSGSPWATWWAAGWRPPRSWGSCAARCAPSRSTAARPATCSSGSAASPRASRARAPPRSSTPWSIRPPAS